MTSPFIQGSKHLEHLGVKHIDDVVSIKANARDIESLGVGYSAFANIKQTDINLRLRGPFTVEVENKPPRSSEKPIIYLAGPMAGCNDDTAVTWRESMTRYLSDDYTIHNPMVRDFRTGYVRELHEKHIVEGDKGDVDRSDIVLAYTWMPSVGTSMEVLYAWERGKTVIVVGHSLSPWLTYHATHVVPDLISAVVLLREMAAKRGK